MSVLKIILIVWVVFSLLYVARNEYNRLSQFVYKQGVTAGFEQAVFDLFNKSRACEPIPVFVENQTEQLINIKCLKNQSTDSPATPEEAAPGDQPAE